MKVILLQDVKKQGKKEDIIDVSDGYAKNFLINKGLAVPYTKTSSNRLEQDKDNRKKSEQKLIAELTIIKNRIEKESLLFEVKTGVDDKIFGTISTKQIKNALIELGYDVKKCEIEIKEPINSLGFYKPQLVLHKKVVASLNVEVRK